MKKILLSLILTAMATSFSVAQNKNVTFQVHSPDSIPVYVFGSWSNWLVWPGDRMNSVGDGYYAVTLSLPVSTTYEFLFVNGISPVKEILDPAWPCTNGNGEYTNRVLSMKTNDTTICYDWKSCNTCTAPANNVAVTFTVHNPDSIPVYVFGSWSNWLVWPGDQMTSIGNGDYAVTLTLPSNTNYEYLFVNGTVPVKEVLNPAWSCTNGNVQYTNRVLALGSTNTSLCFKWDSCVSCTGQSDGIMVKFQVLNPDSVPVYVFGGWSNWGNWPGTPMTSVGNNLYETTIQLKSNQTIEYLFVNGVGPTKEALDPSWACTNGNAQYTNRISTLGSSDTTICFKWGVCQTCGSSAVNSISKDEMKVQLTRDGVRVFSTTVAYIDQIEVYDLLGNKVYHSAGKIKMNGLVPMALHGNAVYLIKISANNQRFTFKGLLTN